MPEKKTDKKTIIIRNIPESIRRGLKSKSAQEGKSMQGVILELITKYVGDIEKKIGGEIKMKRKYENCEGCGRSITDINYKFEDDEIHYCKKCRERLSENIRKSQK